jgi:hypothetical protein
MGTLRHRVMEAEEDLGMSGAWSIRVASLGSRGKLGLLQAAGGAGAFRVEGRDREVERAKETDKQAETDRHRHGQKET